MKIPEMHQVWKRSSNVLYVALVFFIYSFASSCVLPKNYIYFHNLQKDTLYPGDIVKEGVTQFKDPRIEPNDILSVSIQTLAQNEGNSPVSSNVPASPTALSGFLVDKDGYVELSLIGHVKVGGLTTSEARELIKQKAKEFYNSPLVNVRFINFDVTVVGDVRKPGNINIVNQKATILDVLGMAGDLNPTAKRKNILLARIEGDKTTFTRLDLTSTDIYKSPYFYVKQRDYIYVEQNNSKVQSSDNTFVRYVGYLGGVLGIASFLFLAKIIK